MESGHRVVVREYAESPLEAVERCMDLVAMEPPSTSVLSPRDVVIAVKSASVAWVDLLMTAGLYQHLPHPPYTPGMEYAGVVSWVGAEAGESLAVGDSVLVDGLLAGPRSLGDYRSYGGFASYAVAPREAVHRIPGDLSMDQACNLLGNYETAYHCLVARGRVRAGETVLVHGASGGIGLAAVHVARILGATVIATGRSDAKLAVVKEQGAHHTINVRGTDGEGLRPFRDEVKSLTGGRGVDVVYDGVGGDISLESLRCVAFGARFLVAGWASTPFVARGKGQRGAPNANQLPTHLVMMKGLDVLGCPAAISVAHDPAIRAERFETVMGWAASGAVRPYVSKVFRLDDFRSAMRARWNGDVVGGCVLRP